MTVTLMLPMPATLDADLADDVMPSDEDTPVSLSMTVCVNNGPAHHGPPGPAGTVNGTAPQLIHLVCDGLPSIHCSAVTGPGPSVAPPSKRA